MLEFGLLIYGFLLSFVLSSAAHNKRQGRRNPRVLTAVGYVLCGISAMVAAALPIMAYYAPTDVQTLASLS